MHENVILVLKERGIDLTRAVPRLLTKELASVANLLVTMGCKDKCPHIPGLKVIEWDIENIKKKSHQETLEILQKIERKVKELITILQIKPNEPRLGNG